MILARIRGKLGLDQSEFAELAKWGRPDIVKVEQGKNAWLAQRVFDAYSEALGLSVEDLRRLFADDLDEKALVKSLQKRVLDFKTTRRRRTTMARDVETRAREGLAEAGLTQDELAKPVLSVLEMFVRENPDSDLTSIAAEALAIRADIFKRYIERKSDDPSAGHSKDHGKGDERASGTHKSGDSQRPRRR